MRHSTVWLIISSQFEDSWTIYFSKCASHLESQIQLFYGVNLSPLHILYLFIGRYLDLQ